MPITLPEQLHFDPYHESGIVITRGPDRISLKLPRNYFDNLPGFILCGIFLVTGLGLSLFFAIHGHWAGAAFGLLFGAVGGGMPGLATMYFVSRRGVIDITPEDIGITDLGWGQDVEPSIFRWDEITEIRIGGLPHDTMDRPSGLLFALRDKRLQLVLSGRPIGELERLQGLLNSLIVSEVARGEISDDLRKRSTTPSGDVIGGERGSQA